MRKFALLFAALAFSETAFAADLPIVTKAPSATPDYGPRYWLEADFLGWTVTGDRLPALVTTSPAGTPAPLAGVLGAPGTTVLFGNSTVNDDWRAGGKVRRLWQRDASLWTGTDEGNWLAWLHPDPKFDAVRGDPRFQQLLTQVGLIP